MQNSLDSWEYSDYSRIRCILLCCKHFYLSSNSNPLNLSTYSTFTSQSFNYLCTYDLYGPVRNAFDAGSIYYEGKWKGVGPWKSRVFWALWNFIEPVGEYHLGPKKIICRPHMEETTTTAQLFLSLRRCHIKCVYMLLGIPFCCTYNNGQSLIIIMVQQYCGSCTRSVSQQQWGCQQQ